MNKFHPARVLQRLIRRLQNQGRRANRPVIYRTETDLPSSVRLPVGAQATIKGMVDLKHLRGKTYQTRKGKQDWHNCHPDIKRFALAMQRECEKRGIPVWIFEVYRTPERQRELFNKGTTKAGPGSSPHQYGCAVDIISSAKLWDWTETEWQLLGVIGKEVARKCNIKLDWGGDWGWDKPHWQLSHWKQVKLAIEDEGFPQGVDGPDWLLDWLIIDPLCRTARDKMPVQKRS